MTKSQKELNLEKAQTALNYASGIINILFSFTEVVEKIFEMENNVSEFVADNNKEAQKKQNESFEKFNEEQNAKDKE